MGLLNRFFSKSKTNILTDEDLIELKEIQRKSYMEEARKIMQQRGQELAKKELSLNKKSEL